MFWSLITNLTFAMFFVVSSSRNFHDWLWVLGFTHKDPAVGRAVCPSVEAKRGDSRLHAQRTYWNVPPRTGSCRCGWSKSSFYTSRPIRGYILPNSNLFLDIPRLKETPRYGHALLSLTACNVAAGRASPPHISTLLETPEDMTVESPDRRMEFRPRIQAVMISSASYFKGFLSFGDQERANRSLVKSMQPLEAPSS